jgi:hypothetical protein
VARFRLDLISEAKRFRRCPPVALDNNWQGRADVRLTFDATQAFVPVPPALRGREFAVEIPVIFDVQDERVSG